MARTITLTLKGNGATTSTSSPAIIDRYLTPVNIGMSFTSSGSTTTFKVQYSNDDPFASYATDYNTNGTWFDHATLVSLTGSAYGSTTTPIQAIRLSANGTGTDTGTLVINQAGITQ